MSFESGIELSLSFMNGVIYEKLKKGKYYFFFSLMKRSKNHPTT